MRRAVFIAAHFDIQPADIADAATKRFCNSLFHRKPCRKRSEPTAALALFCLCKNSRDKPFTVTLDRFTDALYLDEVNAGGKFHKITAPQSK